MNSNWLCGKYLTTSIWQHANQHRLMVDIISLGNHTFVPLFVSFPCVWTFFSELHWIHSSIESHSNKVNSVKMTANWNMCSKTKSKLNPIESTTNRKYHNRMEKHKQKRNSYNCILLCTHHMNFILFSFLHQFTVLKCNSEFPDSSIILLSPNDIVFCIQHGQDCEYLIWVQNKRKFDNWTKHWNFVLWLVCEGDEKIRWDSRRKECK